METTTLNTTQAIAVPTTPRHGSVLIVDDEEQNRVLLRDSLEAEGFEVTEAERGEEALRQIGTRPPDVVLLDVMMPGMDGFEVCRRLKKNSRTAPIPVLILTALSDRSERLMGIKAGANDFLTKPLDIEDVMLRVANAVHTKRLYDELHVERERSERLLLNVLPPPIAARMKAGETSIADFHPDVTVVLGDLLDFTRLSAHIAPQEVVCLLNEIFSAFDGLARKNGLEKIKTIGDAYLLAGGIPLPQPAHAECAARMALQMRDELELFNRQYNTSIQIRIGISTGPVVAGVIGSQKFAYDLWGDTVNVASRLGSYGDAGEIHVSESTYGRLHGSYVFERKSGVEMKGKGEMVIYELCSAVPRIEHSLLAG